MTNLPNDLSVLTTIAPSNINSLVKLSETVISHALIESVKDREEYAEIDIGIGVLYIKVTEDGMKYKFVPSEHLSSVLERSVKTGKSQLSLKVDEVLGQRIMNTYKDLF
jgi:hypothetical protein